MKKTLNMLTVGHAIAALCAVVLWGVFVVVPLAHAGEQTTLTTPISISASHSKLCITAYAHDCKLKKSRAVFESCTGAAEPFTYTGYVVVVDSDDNGSKVTKPDGTTTTCAKTLTQNIADIDNDAKGFHDGLRELVKTCLGGT